MGSIFGFITFFGWGTGDIFGTFASRKIGAYRATTYTLIFSFLIATLFVPFALGEIHKITLGFLLLNLVMGVGYLFCQFLINEAFKRSSASLVGVLVQSFPAVVLILSAIIFKDAITGRQILWTVIIFAGAILCSLDLRDFKNSRIFTDSGIKLALIAAALLSIYFTFLRVFTDQYGWFWPNYISFATFPIAIIIVRSVFKIKEKLEAPKLNFVLVATFLSAILIRGADIALNLGIARGFSPVVTSIAGASPVLFVGLSSIIFRDPVTKQQKIGIGVCLLGIVLLSFLGK